ncbi:16S rRNA (guanine(527)-N(7))-methyltransferase RsmG [Granulosicoccus antarcticus]|uniref:Ribosomal RNA small subunit methyltransferase G n=1 Tax=Granulosicoccus antarcticus IMCC3135 TaxID=1192854 RepID=A0A2Z2P3C4_9GAMM|nr:16S rRNA (guanine(527)-N(7))-methyltransferase RsmG [Granulosicoccus antarcticus]ASJ76878.1 Ribosomal RNA small subunit methyltransferase G [Granulosicoccus antarcticus IMCC3135]
MIAESELNEALERGLQQLAGFGVPEIPASQRLQLVSLVALLSKWNKVYNLTAVRDPLTMVDRHLLDSLIMSRWLPASSAADDSQYDVMDIGTGAGLPVLPLALVRPDLRFLSIESNGKKIRFQQQALMELGVRNVTVLHDRVENVTDSAHMVLSRAFTAPVDFLKVAEPLCAPDGLVAVMLGHAERLPVSLGSAYTLSELVQVDVPGTDSARHVALCRRQHG